MIVSELKNSGNYIMSKISKNVFTGKRTATARANLFFMLKMLQILEYSSIELEICAISKDLV